MTFARRGLILVLCLLAMGATSAHAKTYNWNQKLTVEVETPQGVVSGSAVTAVEWRDNYIFKDGARKQYTLKGEAVVVNLGNNRYLFALLKAGPKAGAETIADLAPQVVMGKTGRQWSDQAFDGVQNLSRPMAVLPELYPLLVTFEDINDPSSVKLVDPANLAASFGPDVKLKSITMEVTDEAVAKGEVENVIGWLNWTREEFLSRGNGRNPVQIKLGEFTIYIDRTSFRTKI